MNNATAFVAKYRKTQQHVSDVDTWYSRSMLLLFLLIDVQAIDVLPIYHFVTHDKYYYTMSAYVRF